FGVGNFNFWPTTNGPQNVNVKGAGGIQMNVARTVGLLFQYAAGVFNMGNLTLNGTSQVNTGGFTSGSPTYGASSLLRYNTGGTYGRNGEWLPGASAGAGYPAGVQLSNNTTLDLPNSSTTQPFQMSGTLTIDAGSTMLLAGSTPLTQPLVVLGSVNINGNLTLSTVTGGDLTLGGNWTRNSATGTFTPNGRAVSFNGAGTQTVALTSASSETFAYLVVDKPGGNLTLSSTPATSVIVTSPGGGSALQLINAGGIDLGTAGNGLTLNGSVAGTNVLVGGAAAPLTRTVTGTGTFAVTGGDKSVTNNNGKTLVFDTGVNVTLNKGMDFGALLSTVNGTLTVGGGGFVANNAPTYGAASTLLYDCACVFGRGAEWTGATSGPGTPNNVTTNTNTDVDLGSTTPGTALQAAGNLDAKSGGRFLMVLDDNSHAMTSPLSVFGNVLVEPGGTLRLSIVSGGDLKVRGDLTNNGTLTTNNRAVFFEGTATENLADGSVSGGGTAALPYVRINKGGGTVVLQSNLTTLAPSGGDSIQFLGTTNTLTLNGKTLTLGSTVGTPPAGSGLIGDGSANLSLQDGGTGPGGAMGTIAFVGGQTLNNLTINRTGANASATLGSDVTIDGALALTSGDIITGSFTVTQNGTSSGIGDVVGNVRRTGFTNGPAVTNAETFGNPNVQVSFQTGTPATDMTVNLVKSVPTGNGFGYPNAVRRTYTVTQNGASAFTATLRLHYLDSELNGNTEALLDLWRFNGSAWQRVQKTGADILTANNKWVESSLVTQFSPWTLASQPLAPTEARLRETSASAYGDGVLVKWRTGFEVDNLGFRLYRDDGAGRKLITPSLVAGSALTAGPGTVLGAGNSYSWLDAGGKSSSAYYLEDINTGGQSSVSGPFYAEGSGTGRSPKLRRATMLDQLGSGAPAQNWQHQWWPAATGASPAFGSGKRMAAASPTSLADGAAVKLLVRRAGWYRVARAQLEAAGLSPAADPARLQLFVDGAEQAMRVNSDDWQSNGSVEFYGEGVDKQATDTHVYWLIEGQTAGLRIAGQQSATAKSSVGGRVAVANGASTRGTSSHVVPGITIDPPDDSGGSFTYTTELKERTIYFSSLVNGDTENFFGRVVSSTPGTQTVAVENLGGGGADPTKASLDGATLEVALQGVNAGAHSVSVEINGVGVGTIEFAGREHQSASFALEPGVVREGDNQVRLTSSAAGDVSLTDYIRLTYQHKYRADDDTLRFTADAGATVGVGGFHSGVVRVVDITDPNNVTEIQGGEVNFDIGSGEASINIQVGGAGKRTLFAFTDTRVSSVDAALAHRPAGLRDETNEADFVIITHPAFADAVAPLADARRAEGLATKVVSVDDVFDEFSAGEHSAQAVEDFLAWTSQHWKRAPHYVLLVGDGSYDPRNYLGAGAFDLVPAKLIDTSLMETASDSWFADFDGDGLAEMAVGRLPVRTAAEANTVVAKILSYVPADAAHQSALLVADRDGADGYSFESATDGVQTQLPAGASVRRINRGAQSGGDVHSQVVAGVDAGPSVVNWMGHGSVNVWTGDAILSNNDAPSLTNGQHLSLFVMMTCLNGYFQDPSLDGLSEALLKAQNGGAIAAWSSTGMTEPEGQAAMNAELYRALFSGAGPLRLGDAMQRARAATKDADVLRTWVLIGDPTTRWR
ncbi:MAG TPA: C25 family cysteine peptidase, partial [Pyrinomonadaceae bacterium]|nr:C25 family cysteine peptidase [Pyrinomonadaceae bacterium]